MQLPAILNLLSCLVSSLETNILFLVDVAVVVVVVVNARVCSCLGCLCGIFKLSKVERFRHDDIQQHKTRRSRRSKTRRRRLSRVVVDCLSFPLSNVSATFLF